MKTSAKSILKGFLIAPVVAPVIYCLLALMMPQVREHPALNVVEWFKVTGAMVLLMYVICLATGGPLFFLLKRFKKLTPTWFILLGAFLYALVVYIVIFQLSNAHPQGDMTRTLVTVCGGSFLMGALTYWIFSKVANIEK